MTHQQPARAPIKKLFIANRGEIAVRIARTCRHLGIHTVAGFTPPDAGANYLGWMDEAAPLGQDPRAYLDVRAIMDAALNSGADAIHPGYGFLSERPELAAACLEKGLIFVGPSPDVLRLLGDKCAARRLARDIGVPVVPGSFHSVADVSLLEEQGRKLGPPLLIKAAAGGGGVGMRQVHSPDLLPQALEQAAGEAVAAFGDGSLYLEKLLAPVRHVEVQVLGDRHGTVAALGERECSLQRRHQKLIEESPSPAVDQHLRQPLSRAALLLARAAGYQGAGTVEFLLTPDGRFHFLEVNARLQVEHPVTEARFGLDLVEWQIRVAAGEPLSPAVLETKPRGWAMEARIYAESPERGFMPSPGRIVHLELAGGPGIRVDSGVALGTVVPLDYDPILAKLVAWAPSRERCRKRLSQALSETVILGVASNAHYLRRILDEPSFVRGELDTKFLERLHDVGLPEQDLDPPERELILAAAAMGSVAPRRPLDGPPAPSLPVPRSAAPSAAGGPWELLNGLRVPE